MLESKRVLLRQRLKTSILSISGIKKGATIKIKKKYYKKVMKALKKSGLKNVKYKKVK